MILVEMFCIEFGFKLCNSNMTIRVLNPILEFLKKNPFKAYNNFQVGALEGIMSFATNKLMTRCPKWLYNWF